MTASTSWPLLPGALRADLDTGAADGTGDVPRAPVPARSARDWAVDLAAVLLAALIGAVNIGPDVAHGLGPGSAADLATGVCGCLALPLRRRYPMALAVAVVAASAYSTAVGGAAFIATFSVAVHRRLPEVAWVAALGVATALTDAWLHPAPHVPYVASVTIDTLLTAAAVGWGRLVHARRQLLVSLAERARRAEADQRARIAEARRLERTRLAREMHDVLAHRMSLISVHAGALEFRPGASEAEIARAAGVIRSGVHQMSADLREVIGLLREDPDEERPEETVRPGPALAALPELAEESRRAGTTTTLDMAVGEPAAAPSMTGRTAYRIVQEGLTNARKHAPGAPVTVTVRGAAGDGLAIEVRQPVRPAPPGRGPAGVPGSGVGLVGLAERALLAGGRLEHGPTDGGEYLLRAWLPWEA